MTGYGDGRHGVSDKIWWIMYTAKDGHGGWWLTDMTDEIKFMMTCK
jgi:hypothetical protein